LVPDLTASAALLASALTPAAAALTLLAAALTAAFADSGASAGRMGHMTVAYMVKFTVHMVL
jgi:hypothetical protein